MDLREDLAILGDPQRIALHSDTITSWANAPGELTHRWLRPAAILLAAAATVTAAIWAVWGVGFPFLAVLVIEAGRSVLGAIGVGPETGLTEARTAVLFAVFGFLLYKFGCEPAPLVLGFILGPLMEENLRRSMVLSRGDPMIFVTRPLSLTLLLMAAAVVLLVALPQFRKTRETAFQE